MVNNKSEWAIIRCYNCNQVFSVPSVMIGEYDDNENYRSLNCPYCIDGDEIKIDDCFISHQEMNCKVDKVIRWEID